jgi:hypothetical protein
MTSPQNDMLANHSGGSIIIPLDVSDNPTRPAEQCQSIAELFHHHSIVMHPSRYPMWRLTNRHSATIKGQPYLGLSTLVATDGVHGFIETPAKPFLFRIHITNFEGIVETLGTQHLGYNPKGGEKKKRITKAERVAAKAEELLTELGL